MTRASLLLLVLAVVTTPAEVRRDTRDPDTLVAHEWGTFTTVAGEHGEAIEWLPLQGPNDLPCFVERFRNFRGKVAIAATVRMETPVIYFYAPRQTTVDVAVRFPRGLVTEWYPRAAVTPAATLTDAAFTAKGFTSSARWSRVTVVPGGSEAFPTEAKPSHYYAARRTDAATLRVGNQTEKFLFYRGIATVKLPLSATVSPDGIAHVSRDGAQPLGTLVRFDRRDGKLGFEVRTVAGSRTSLDTPPLTDSLDALATRLEGILTGAGLYPREARAMVETWRGSWFEEGTRLLYILPRADVDALLPLEIKPQPVETARVFVGRMELITPATTADVKRALDTRDRAALMKYGRFLLPIAQRVAAAEAAAGETSGPNARDLQQFIYGAFADVSRGTTCAPGGVGQ
jgi:hypothetical protein